MSNFVNIIYGLPNSRYPHKLAELVASHIINHRNVAYFVLDQLEVPACKLVLKALESNGCNTNELDFKCHVHRLVPNECTFEELSEFCTTVCLGYKPDVVAIDYPTLLKAPYTDQYNTLKNLQMLANTLDVEVLAFMPNSRISGY